MNFLFWGRVARGTLFYVLSFILTGPASYRFADPCLLEGLSWAIDLASQQTGLSEVSL